MTSNAQMTSSLFQAKKFSSPADGNTQVRDEVVRDESRQRSTTNPNPKLCMWQNAVVEGGGAAADRDTIDMLSKHVQDNDQTKWNTAILIRTTNPSHERGKPDRANINQVT